jgi:hypothetical protein
MQHIGVGLAAIERNMRLNSADPIALHGFTQVPNFICAMRACRSAPRPSMRCS